MSDTERNKKPEKGSIGSESDSEARLQDELARESSEGTDSIGDVSSNRTLSGSSTWETLPEDQSKGGESSAP